MVGFDKEAETLVERFKGGMLELEIVSIIGMGDQGGKFSRDLLGKKAPVVEEGNMVGFDNEAETLVERLKGGRSELEIVSIIGMGDLDKTTLVRKVFTDPSIQYEFNSRAWI
ncbi:hypothetical protein U1Q18_001962 [Sarracenia purpurea var. burkii]